MLDILGLPTRWQAAPHKPRRFLVNPCEVRFVVGIASVEVVGLADYPVERRLADALAATLGRGLSDDELLRLTDAVHSHGCRS